MNKGRKKSVEEVAIRICIREAIDQRSFKPLTWLWKKQYVGATHPRATELYYGTMFDLVREARRVQGCVATIWV